MLLGGALANALAFSGSNFLFKMLGHTGVDAERRRHDLALEKLQAAQQKWAKDRANRLDWINEELQRQQHSVQTFRDVDVAMHEYAKFFPQKQLSALGPRPEISDFYVPSEHQKDLELAFIAISLGLTGFVAYKLV